MNVNSPPFIFVETIVVKWSIMLLGVFASLAFGYPSESLQRDMLRLLFFLADK